MQSSFDKLKGEKVLLHTCCAICSAHPIKHLQSLGYEVVCYFYNPNIHPQDEHQKRLEAQETLCKSLKCKLVIEEYAPQEFFQIGLAGEPEKGKRCEKCFELRLSKTFKAAHNLGINNVSTSIVISPHKNFELISQIGLNFGEKYGINYLSIDFKKNDGLKKSNEITKQLGLYRQNYCGCKYSIRVKND